MSQSPFVQQCTEFEDTLQSILLERTGALVLQLSLQSSADTRPVVTDAIDRILKTGKITEADRKALEMLASSKVTDFERAMDALQQKDGKSSFSLMRVERDTLQDFILHLVFESISRRLSGKRGEDFAILERADRGSS